MADFDEAEQRLPKLISFHASCFLIAVFFLGAALDVADSFITIVNHQAVAEFACAIRPLAVVPVLNFSGFSQQWIADQCMGQVRDPAISMIFFSIKLSMAPIVCLVLCEFLCERPEGFWALKAFYWQKFSTRGGFERELKAFGKSVSGVFIFLTCCLLLASSIASDPRSSFILESKFAIENGLAIAIPGMTFVYGIRAFFFASFARAARSHN
jgi:hypothetical protein